MAYGLSLALRNAIMTAYRDALDADTNPGKFLIYGGTRPATGAAITTQTLLGTCTLSKPCGTVANGSLTFSAISNDISADATGNITWVRAVDGADNFVLDMGAGVSGSGAEAVFNAVDVQAGGVIQIQSCVVTEGNI